MEEVKVKSNKVRKILAFLFMLVITTVVCGVAYFMATKEYEAVKKQVLTQEYVNVSTWVDNTAAQVNLWTGSLNAQAKRVSTSELYRLFAADAVSLSHDQTLRLNDDTVETSSLSEQVPLMRNVLTDFMNFNGYTDARILDKNGITLLSAQARPSPIDAAQTNAAMKSIAENKEIFAPVIYYQNGAILHFAEPLKAVLSQVEDEKPIATLLLSTPVTSIIARFLTHDVARNDFAPYIVQENGNDLELLDLQGVSFKKVDKSIVGEHKEKLPFGERLSASDPSRLVWSYGVYLPHLRWWVVAEISAQALQETLAKEAAKVYGFAITFTAGFMLVLALLWWIVVGREQKANARRFESLYELIGGQKRILDNVNAALDTGLLAADVTGKIIMANRAFGELCSCDYENVANENIAPLFDPTFTHELLSGIAKASRNSKPLTAEYSAILGNETRLLRLTFFPFLDNEVDESLVDDDENMDAEEKAIQAVKDVKKAQETKKTSRKEKDSLNKYENAALITFTDITEFRRQSNAKRHVQEKSMQALVRAVESMDPYLSGHSRRMEQLGILVCKNLDLPANDVNTVAIAANLSQVGKLFVSRDLLLKQGALSAEEKAQLLSIPEKAWLTLKEIDFHLPVPQAVHDMYERLDGKGYPRQLSGDNIGLHARVLSVVNTFCAMTAPRSYRKGIAIGDTLGFLRKDIAYDQRIVSALEEVLSSSEGLEIARAVPEQENVVV